MNDYTGPERRQGYTDIQKDISEIKIDIAVIKNENKTLSNRINGSIEDIEKHIEHGLAWRLSIVGVFITLLIQLSAFIYFYGQLNEKVQQSAVKIYDIELLHPRK